eukprot:TRINITY_DN5234_c0_g1::TRINITY_DN5234_c0_g1_i1::g.23537::m.23537 TRINITY_DN5234_c0_g1::TRINITY_DN5234_c0_g1_i1::g.23537  ORF type:complete len:110 (+),score=8.56,Gallidermin/PF02052.10/3.8e+03,Gallidermin/PF02052.10/0.16 TRINITY_DN5234_c0_g1_i1:116-445(+)
MLLKESVFMSPATLCRSDTFRNLSLASESSTNDGVKLRRTHTSSVVQIVCARSRLGVSQRADTTTRSEVDVDATLSFRFSSTDTILKLRVKSKSHCTPGVTLKRRIRER